MAQLLHQASDGANLVVLEAQQVAERLGVLREDICQQEAFVFLRPEQFHKLGSQRFDLFYVCEGKDLLFSTFQNLEGAGEQAWLVK